MILISHRGNLNGPSDLENSPDHIKIAIDNGFVVEVDVWVDNGVVFLGHDKPTYEVSIYYIRTGPYLWHAKNKEALLLLNKMDVHYFWHEEDRYALTSRSFIITHPNSEIIDNSIVMLPEKMSAFNKGDMHKAIGICSDYIASYK